MDVPVIPKEDGILKKACNKSFFGVKKYFLLKSIRESEKYDKGLAAILGGGAGFGIAQGGKWILNSEIGQNAMDFISTYGPDLDLEKITAYCLAFTLGTLIMPRIIAPRYVKKFKEENPVYSVGTKWVMYGASLKAVQELGLFKMLSHYIQ